MRAVIFYEKPGCVTNAKQKKLLRQAGCMLLERNLLEHGLDIKSLRTFFYNLPIRDWFNPNAPKIKAGEIDPDALSEVAAMELLMKEPILIRRPLMVIGDEKLCGFDAARLEELLGKAIGHGSMETCSNPHETCN
jgi:nitrogenase-associated protein